MDFNGLTEVRLTKTHLQAKEPKSAPLFKEEEVNQPDQFERSVSSSGTVVKLGFGMKYNRTDKQLIIPRQELVNYINDLSRGQYKDEIEENIPKNTKTGNNFIIKTDTDPFETEDNIVQLAPGITHNKSNDQTVMTQEGLLGLIFFLTENKKNQCFRNIILK